MQNILSLDLSLSNTGYAIFSSNICVESGNIKVKIKSTKCNVCCTERLYEIKDRISQLIEKYDGFKFCIIEGYSYTKNSQALSGLYELGGVIKNLLYENNIQVIIIPPMTAKKFLDNKQAYKDGKESGMSNKEITYKLICNKMGKWDFKSDDEADAYLFGYILMKYLRWNTVKDKSRFSRVETEVFFYVSLYIQNYIDCKMKHFQLIK